MGDFDLEPTLVGKRVTLAPLCRADRAGLLAAVSDGELWKLKVTSAPSRQTIDDYIDRAIEGRSEGHMIPFATRVGDEIVGCTRFWKVNAANRKAEIGHTWIAASWQRSFVNTEAKLLMLRHAFEVMGLIRVQFQTDELNHRSRTAILRLGAVEEGLLRNERIMPDGRVRNTMRYSIIDSEWPAVKARLSSLLG
jgi:N-acetyltransferase